MGTQMSSDARPKRDVLSSAAYANYIAVSLAAQERYGLTELKKAANRMIFNQAEDEFHDGEDTIGLGVIGKEGSGRLRAVRRGGVVGKGGWVLRGGGGHTTRPVVALCWVLMVALAIPLPLQVLHLPGIAGAAPSCSTQLYGTSWAAAVLQLHRIYKVCKTCAKQLHLCACVPACRWPSSSGRR